MNAYDALLLAAQRRIAAGHGDTCPRAYAPGDDPCDCGHDALVNAVNDVLDRV